MFQIFAAVLCDMIWFSRNQAIHRGILPDALKLAENIKRVTMEHFAAWSSKQKLEMKTWSKPPPDCYKINFDAVSSKEFSTQAAVCRNSSGKIIKMFTQFRPPCSSTYGAALAAHLAAHLAALLASSMKLSNFILEGVSHVIMDALKSPALNNNAHISHLIQATITSFPPSSYWRQNIFPEVKISAPFMWHIGPWQGFTRAAFPPYFLPLALFPSVAGKIPPF
jgi:hypothetical protein